MNKPKCMTDKQGRRLDTCPACGAEKTVNTVVCWTCYRAPGGLKYSTLPFKEWLSIFRRTL